METNNLGNLPGITNGVDGEGRVSTVSAGSGQNPVTSTSYNPASEVTALTLGSSDSDAFTFDPNTFRITQYQFNVNGKSVTGALTWNANGTLGKLAITDAFNSTNTQTCTYSHDDLARIASGNCGSVWSQTFTYDQLNRISIGGSVNTSGTNCWGEQYGIDAWDNLLTITSPSGYSSCAQPDNLRVSVTAANQISGYTYDAAGNLTTIPGTGGATYTYNAKNQITTSSAGVNYTYDGDGNRVEKSNGTLYWYGTSSDPLEETGLTGAVENDYVFFGGQRIARLLSTDSSGIIFGYFADQLGSSRKVEEIASGGSTASLSYDADFYPFGRENAFVNSTSPIYKFIGKLRDSESGLDDFGARYNSSTIGRFMSPDSLQPTRSQLVLEQFLADPQSWNKYAYSLNNPVTYRDQSGHFLDRDHERIQMNAMLAAGYSQAASSVAAKANSAMDNWRNWAGGVPYLNHVWSTAENPQHGETANGQTVEEAKEQATDFIFTKTLDAAQAAVAGDAKDALVDLGQASHTAQDIVRHQFESASEHPLIEAAASPEEIKVATQATKNILDNFAEEVTELGEQKGLTKAQINEILKFTKQETGANAQWGACSAHDPEHPCP